MSYYFLQDDDWGGYVVCLPNPEFIQGSRMYSPHIVLEEFKTQEEAADYIHYLNGGPGRLASIEKLAELIREPKDDSLCPPMIWTKDAFDTVINEIQKKIQRQKGDLSICSSMDSFHYKERVIESKQALEYILELQKDKTITLFTQKLIKDQK